MIHVPSGSALPLTLTLFDGDVAKFPQAHIYDQTGTEVVGSPFNLTHKAHGHYEAAPYTPTSDGVFKAVYVTYQDSGHTTRSNKHSIAHDLFEVDPNTASVAAIKAQTDQDPTRHTALIAEHDATQAAVANVQSDVDDLQSKVGLPVSTLAGDIASIQADTNDIQSKIGAPVVTVSADIAAARSALQAEHDQTQDDIADFRSAMQTEHDTTQAAVAAVQSDINVLEPKVDAIKAQTDQLVFEGGRTAAVLHTSERDDIVDRVWSEDLVTYVPNTAGHLLYNLNINNYVDAFWNALLVNHVVPGSFGELMQVINQTTFDIEQEILDGDHGLQEIYDSILAQTGIIVGEINVNEGKIDNIIPAVNAAKAAVIAEVDQNELLISALGPQLTAAQAALKAEIDANEAKLDTIIGSVGSLSNNTTVRFVVPERLIKPSVGSKTYQFHLRLFDDVGNPEAPDSTPTIRVRDLVGGVDVVVAAPMTQDGVKVGAYFYSHTISAGTDTHPFLVEATVVEGGVTRYVPAVTEVSEFEGDLDAIQSSIAALDLKTSDVQTKVNDGTFGLSALKSGQVALKGEVDVNEALIQAVKAKTDNLPAAPAAVSDVTAVTAAVMTRPDINQIQARLDLLRDVLRGTANRDMTEIYDKIDFSTLVQSSDPRLANLDAPITSRSTLTSAQVWSYSTRELTAITLPASLAADVWGYLASSAASVPGSLGKRVADFLDASVSSRATTAAMSSLLLGVAQESTVNAILGALTIEINQNEVKLNTLLSLANAIKPKTDNIPGTPATEPNVTNQAAALANLISQVDLIVTAIKAKTDNLPAQPAQQGSVLAIPTNPVLVTDPRLTLLDAAVSSRSTLSPAAIAPLATTAQLNQAKSDIIAQVDQNEAKIDQANAAIALRPTGAQMDTKLLPIAKSSEVEDAKDEIITEIGNIPAGPGGGATPAQIWSHPTRTLTADPTDLSLVAKSSELAALAKIQYVCKMSTVFQNLSGNQRVIAWAEKDGQRVVSTTNCSVTVKDKNGNVMWTDNLTAPNADGVFEFTKAISATVDENYYAVITIVVDGQPRTSHQSFFTVG